MAPRQASTSQSNFDTDSVYYVHPSEGPSSLAISLKLKGSNYLAWSRSMQHALGAKNKLTFIDGSMPIPDLGDLNHSDWERCNHLLHSWVLNSISESIAPTIVFHDTTISAWEDLNEHFAKVDHIYISTLRSAFNNLRQGTKYVLEYFIEMRSLRDELNSHRPIPNCTCVHPCRCDFVHVSKNYRTEIKSFSF